jgi:putative phosphoribosyl transferase
MTRVFENRTTAGLALARRLGEYADRRYDTIVVGLPRGGVPVAAQIAAVLQRPLDIVLARKLGAPDNPEYAIGAISMTHRVLNHSAIRALGIDAHTLAEIEHRERRELLRRETLYRQGRPPLDLRGKTVLLIDDGIATGLTMQCAALTIDDQHPARLIVATPVAADETVRMLAELPEIDACISLLRVPALASVGMWYCDFAQVSDLDVARAFCPPAADATGQLTG